MSDLVVKIVYFCENGNPENKHSLAENRKKQTFNFARLQTLTKLSNANKLQKLSNVRPSATTFINTKFFCKLF